MNTFIFQATEEGYSPAPKTGERISWNAQRYRTLMHPGDLVFFWLAGAPTVRGIHAWGHLASEPYEVADGYQVDAVFERQLVPHLSAVTLQNIRDLKNLQIFTVRVGSNFLLEESEVAAIMAQIPPEQRPKT